MNQNRKDEKIISRLNNNKGNVDKIQCHNEREKDELPDERFIDSSERPKRSIKYIPGNGFSRYSNALKNLKPWRRKESSKSQMGIDDAGLFSFIYSTWITKYLWAAYYKGVLELTDLPLVSQLDSCYYNTQRLEILWNDEVSKKGPVAASFPKIVWRFVRTRVLTSCLLIFLSQVASLISSMMLTKKILEHLSDTQESFWDGLKWVILLGFFDTLRALLFSWGWMVNYRTALRLKAACLTLLYRKIIYLNNLGSKTTGELINIFSNDGQRVSDVIVYGPMIICGPVITVFAIICIIVWLSPIALLGMLVFFIFYPIQYLISRLYSHYRHKTIEIADSRIQSTIEVLDCIKIIKMYGWERYFARDILKIRERERKWLWKTACTNSFGSSLTPAVPIMTVIVTFLAHLSMGHNLTPAVAFPISTLIVAQMRRSFTLVQASLFYLADSTITYDRLKSVLLLEDTSCHILRPIVRSQAISIVNGKFICDIYDKNSNKVNSVKKKSNKKSTNQEPELERLKVPISESCRVELLSDITFEATKGKLIGVCGHVGSGKSSLLLAALGQIKMTTGQLMRDGTCAYVSQQAWIVNASFKENILFGEVYEPKRYYKTLSVCCLKDDVNMLPAGDETEIGERGVNLSGGQKQRVALARAFYADRDIYFLDDPLSAVDANVALEIFETLILDELSEKTIIFVTHQIQHLNKCDDIYLMREGKIVEHGTHEELMRLDKEYASMVKTLTVSTSSDEYIADGDNELKEDLLKDEENDCKIRKRRMTGSYKDNQKSENKDSNAASTQVDKVERGAVKWSTYNAYIEASGGYVVLTLIVLAFVFHAGIGVFSSWWLAIWLKAGSNNTTIQIGNETVVSDNINDNPDFSFYKTVYASFFLFTLLACLLRGVVLRSGTINASVQLHKLLLNKLIYAPLKFFDTTPSGRIQNLFSRDMEEVDAQLPITLESTFQCFFLCVLTFLTVICTLPWFIVPSVFLSVIFYYVWKIYRAGLTNLKRFENILRSPVYSFVTFSSQGLCTIRAFKKECEFLTKFQELLDRNNACHFMCDIAMRWLATRFDSLASASTCIAAFIIISLKGSISPSIAGLALTYAIQMSGTFQYAIRMISEVEVRFVSVERIYQYLKALVPENNLSKVITVPSDEWPRAGKIEFINVVLNYYESSPSNCALDNVSFKVETGQKIGIVGKTGSGKSSLVSVMFRLYEITKGKILIDDLDISTIDLPVLRKNLTIIPQDPILFSGTVRYYLDPIKAHSDADIWNALERTHLKHRISIVNKQLDADIGLGGKNFSMGERQLLCLARALLRDTKILILDEATASVDPETEVAVHHTIQEQFSNCTVLIIAHRLQAVMSCDKVLVMDKGKVAEFDTPSELLNNPNSKFANMLAAAEDFMKHL